VRRAAGPGGSAGESFRRWLTGNDVWMLAHVLFTLAFRSVIARQKKGTLWYPCEKDVVTQFVPATVEKDGSRLAAYVEDTGAKELGTRLKLVENKGLW
jgi:hypothetical protein